MMSTFAITTLCSVATTVCRPAYRGAPAPNQERGRQSPPGYPDIYVVSNVLDERGDPIGALGASGKIGRFSRQ
jgi:hypothetical protein